jgi:hypothetical protein
LARSGTDRTRNYRRFVDAGMCGIPCVRGSRRHLRRRQPRGAGCSFAERRATMGWGLPNASNQRGCVSRSLNPCRERTRVEYTKRTPPRCRVATTPRIGTMGVVLETLGRRVSVELERQVAARDHGEANSLVGAVRAAAGRRASGGSTRFLLLPPLDSSVRRKTLAWAEIRLRGNAIFRPGVPKSAKKCNESMRMCGGSAGAWSSGCGSLTLVTRIWLILTGGVHPPYARRTIEDVIESRSVNGKCRNATNARGWRGSFP